MAGCAAPSTVTVACSGIEMSGTMTLVRLTPEPSGKSQSGVIQWAEQGERQTCKSKAKTATICRQAIVVYRTIGLGRFVLSIDFMGAPVLKTTHVI